MGKFKVGDEVKIKEVPRIGTSGGKIETVKRIEEIEVNQGIGFKHYLSNQEEYPVPYFFFDELEKVETIEEMEKLKAELKKMTEAQKDTLDLFKRSRGLNQELIKENNSLKEQLDYADKQLERQADIIDRLEEHAHELHDKLIEKMKGE